MKSILQLGSGLMSTFGGPSDLGVGPAEGLALLAPIDLGLWWYGSLFLPAQPVNTSGLARRLNPKAFYCAMRWDEVLAPHGFGYYATVDGVTRRDPFVTSLLRGSFVRFTNPRNGVTRFGRPVDYGPGDGSIIAGKPTQDTGRIADLSPGLADALALQTDQKVICELILSDQEMDSILSAAAPLQTAPPLAAAGGKEVS